MRSAAGSNCRESGEHDLEHGMPLLTHILITISRSSFSLGLQEETLRQGNGVREGLTVRIALGDVGDLFGDGVCAHTVRQSRPVPTAVTFYACCVTM